MSNSINHERKTSLLNQLVANAMYELKDFDPSNVSINDVVLSRDGSHAKVYITIFKDQARYFEKVKNMTPFIRSVVARSWRHRKVPQLVFSIDEVESKASRIETILAKIKNENNE
ncbi:30S ribosome-binding factor RbfA [Mycoplasma phocoenae]|uniref:Ribosome-binding factor A n=1 Tax=Mycoplasma phocoenae TaxID=754517 RepID=A0A858U480_9MOLU|nr:30S ribosome-binding factor RbfA [Mycoplasma phocoenae]QJG66879.1 30S ribosome-binding factor RbfA [Mycoplasma phocoenae]